MTTEAGRTLLDEVVPAYEFSEVHETVVRAPPDEVVRAIKELSPAEIPLFRQLFAVRRLPERLLRRKSDFAPREPLLGQMLTHGFILLGEEPEQELVFGTIGQFWKLKVAFETLVDTPEDFVAFDRSGYGKAVMNFRLTPADGGAVLLRTETRVHIADPEARKKFARYWRVTGPGSRLIRRMWLRAIKRRAER